MWPTCTGRLLTLEVTTSLEAQKPGGGAAFQKQGSLSAHCTANRGMGGLPAPS